MNKALILTISACIFTGIASDAGEKALLDQIAQHNKELQVARANLEGEKARTKSENNLSDPDLEVETMLSPETSWEFTLSETVEWPGVYMARHKASGYRISAQEYLYESAVLNIKKQARLAYIDIINLNRQLARQKQILTMVNGVLDDAQNPDLATEFTIIDITKFKLKALEILENIRNLNIRKKNAIAGLEILNGGIELNNVDFSAEQYDIQLKDVSYYTRMYMESPDYKAEQQQALAAKYDLSASKRSYFPNLKLGYKFAKDGGTNAHGIVFGISLPVFSNRHKVKAAQTSHVASTLSWQKSEFEMTRNVQILYGELVSLESAIAKYQAILNNEDLDMYLKKAYEGKSITAIRYLYESEFLLEAIGKLDDMTYAYNSKYVELTKYDMSFE